MKDSCHPRFYVSSIEYGEKRDTVDACDNLRSFFRSRASWTSALPTFAKNLYYGRITNASVKVLIPLRVARRTGVGARGKCKRINRPSKARVDRESHLLERELLTMIIEPRPIKRADECYAAREMGRI